MIQKQLAILVHETHCAATSTANRVLLIIIFKCYAVLYIFHFSIDLLDSGNLRLSIFVRKNWKASHVLHRSYIRLTNMAAKLAESSLCVHHTLIVRRRNRRHFGKLGNYKCTSDFTCSDDFTCIISSYDVPTNIFVAVLTRHLSRTRLRI